MTASNQIILHVFLYKHIGLETIVVPRTPPKRSHSTKDADIAVAYWVNRSSASFCVQGAVHRPEQSVNCSERSELQLHDNLLENGTAWPMRQPSRTCSTSPPTLIYLILRSSLRIYLQFVERNRFLSMTGCWAVQSLWRDKNTTTPCNVSLFCWEISQSLYHFQASNIHSSVPGFFMVLVSSSFLQP